MTLTVFGLFFALMLLLATPIVTAMGASALAGLVLFTDIPLVVFPQRMFVILDSFPLMAVPYYILAGGLMERGGISVRLVRFATALIGRFRGGLGLVDVFASMIFSGVSGSGTADTAAIGSLMIPPMIRRGYPRGYAAALQAAAGGLGPIIPPSILMIIYAALVNQSPGRMFLGAIVPGLVMGLGFMVMVYVYAVRTGLSAEPAAGWGEVARTFLEAGWSLLTPAIILGGIVLGVFTATEAGIAAVVYALFVGLFIHRDLSLGDLPGIVLSAARTTTLAMFILGMAGIFAWLLAVGGAAATIREAILAVSVNGMIGALLVIAFLVIAGGFVDFAVLVVLFVPVLHPLGVLWGFDDLAWAVTLSIAIVIGGVMPPVAEYLFISTAIAEVPLETSSRYALPFVAWMVGVVVLCLLFPELVLALPRWLLA